MIFTGIPLGTALALAAGAAMALVLLHRLRVRPTEMRVITTMFWTQAAERTRARTLWQRFRHPLTFLMLLAFCLLLVLALLRPQWSQEPPARVYEVIVVDAGMTMAVQDGANDSSRLDAACEAVLAESDRLSSQDRLAVVVADPVPRLLHRFEEPRAALPARLTSLKPATRPAAFDDALRLGRCLLRGRPNPQLALITDRPAVDPSNHVHVVDVGRPADNAAILSVMFEPDRANPLRGRLGIRVGFWGRSPRDVSVEVNRGGGAPLYQATQRVVPGDTVDVIVPDVPADGDTVVARLLPEDPVAADDETVVRLPLRTPIRVGSDAEIPDVLRVALQADPAVRWVGGADQRDVDVRMEGGRPARRRPAIIVSNHGPELAAGHPLRVVRGTGMLKGLQLDGATCGSGSSVDGSIAAMQPVLMAGDQIVVGLATSGRPSAFYVCPALLAEDSDIVRRPAFAVLVAEAIRRLAGWDADPITLATARVVADPLWARRHESADAVWLMPGSREVSDLSRAGWSAPHAEAARAGRWAGPALYQVGLFLALGVFLADALLHARGRIS